MNGDASLHLSGVYVAACPEGLPALLLFKDVLHVLKGDQPEN